MIEKLDQIRQLGSTTTIGIKSSQQRRVAEDDLDQDHNNNETMLEDDWDQDLIGKKSRSVFFCLISIVNNKQKT